MANYKIITDSACDLPVKMLQELDVTTVALTVNFRGETRNDSVDDAQVKELYDAMRAGEVATTAAVNPDGWSKVIESAVAEGFDAFVLAFSSGLSTTYQSAVIAANELAEKYPQRKVLVVDTLCASLGQGLFTYYACQKRDEGLSLDALADWVEENKFHLCHFFTVDDLMYLKRGGRVSAATALFGTMLQIKPVLHVDDAGHLINIGKVRGRRASIDALVEKAAALCLEEGREVMYICHGDCMDDAEYLKAKVQAQLGVKEVHIGYTGAVIGSHSGPGTLALFFLGQHR